MELQLSDWYVAYYTKVLDQLLGRLIIEIINGLEKIARARESKNYADARLNGKNNIENEII